MDAKFKTYEEIHDEQTSEGFGQLGGLIRTKQRFNLHFEFKSHHLCAYIRKTSRFNSKLGKMMFSLDLASIEVDEPFRNQGYCSDFLKKFETLGLENGLNIFVECVHIKQLQDMLERRNYIREEEENNESSVCNFWKLTQENQ